MATNPQAPTTITKSDADVEAAAAAAAAAAAKTADVAKPPVSDLDAMAALIDPAPKLPKLELKNGATGLFSAVHGRLIHPYLRPEVEFNTDQIKKVAVDDWIRTQFDAGKLKLA